jgi:hypothetical protein
MLLRVERYILLKVQICETPTWIRDKLLYVLLRKYFGQVSDKIDLSYINQGKHE